MNEFLLNPKIEFTVPVRSIYSFLLTKDLTRAYKILLLKLVESRSCRYLQDSLASSWVVFIKFCYKFLKKFQRFLILNRMAVQLPKLSFLYSKISLDTRQSFRVTTFTIRQIKFPYILDIVCSLQKNFTRTSQRCDAN